MTTSGKDEEAKDFSDSDQQWFDRLGGKLTAATDESALREADALRRALAAEQSAAARDAEIAAANTAEEGERQWQRLQFRLKQEGMLKAPPPSRRRFWQVTAGLAAAMLVAVLVIPPPAGDEPALDEPPTLRGAFTLVKRHEIDPRMSTEVLAAELKTAGLRPRQYRRGRTYFIDVELPTDANDQAISGFKRAGLDPKPGITRIEVSPR
jgi:hypothetical protein